MFAIIFLVIFLVACGLTSCAGMLMCSLICPRGGTVTVAPLSRLFNRGASCCAMFGRARAFMLVVTDCFFYRSYFMLNDSI